MRYLPLTPADRQSMLAEIGVNSIEDLFADVPTAARHSAPFENLSFHMPEWEVERALSRLAGQNITADNCPFFLGAGAYNHHIPAAVDQLLLRGEFLTSYTPYQPEVSQGTLQCLFEFQTQVALITGMEISNASMYDGASACAESVLMAGRITGRRHVLLSGALHPHYADVARTIAELTDYSFATTAANAECSEKSDLVIDEHTACVVVQYPDVFGNIVDYSALAAQCHNAGALLVIVVTEIVALGLLRPPGAMGADIVVAEGQSLGNNLNFGGPYVGLLATREKFVRQMPGRVCGQTTDADGKRGFVLTLSAREQHIRREKATSNICTNSGLCALAFTMHLSLLGEAGFRQLAALNHARAVTLAGRLARLKNCKILNHNFFNEFTLELPVAAQPVVQRLAEIPILAGVPVSRLFGTHDVQLQKSPARERQLILAATELTRDEDIEKFVVALEQTLNEVLK